MKRLVSTVLIFILCTVQASAHPMPNSVMQLYVNGSTVSVQLQWPLNELQLAFPAEDIDAHPATLVARKGAWLDAYLLTHMSVTDAGGHAWAIAIAGKKVVATRQSLTGPYRELVFTLLLQPPIGASPRHFTMHYDAIMHQVVTHKMLVSLRQDWDGGLSARDSADADLGVLMMNTSDNKVPPVIVNLDEGSKWKGFKSMVSLGISHIAEGTDHLLFLLVLLLSAPLIAAGGRWSTAGGAKYSALRLLNMATAFTLGHSLTLLAGAIGWLRLPAQPVELLICLSIIISAVHALRPIFPGREVYVAAGFGLVHGLAFAATLAGLNIDGTRMALGILGFNIGIELMQLFVILLFVPWLVMLSHYAIYKWVRITGALFAVVASCAWIMERITQSPSKLTSLVKDIAAQGRWVILALALMAIAAYILDVKKNSNRVR